MTKPITLFAVAVATLLMLLMPHSAYASGTWNLTILPSNTFAQNTQYAHIAITGSSNTLVLLYADGHLIEGSTPPYNYSLGNWVAGTHNITAIDNATGARQSDFLTILPPPGAGGTPIYKRNTTVAIVKGINTTGGMNAVQSRILSAYGYALDFEGVNGNLSIPLWYMAEAVLLISAVILYVRRCRFQYPLVLGIGIFVVFIILGV
jgi:hypothetical protein